MTKIAINGFGRIGRLAARIILTKFRDRLELVAINTSGNMPVAGWAYLLKHDSVYGQYAGSVAAKDQQIVVDGQTIQVLAERNPAKIPWQKYGPSVVLECTGSFTKKSDLETLLTDSVKKVVLSAPAKEGPIPMYVIGVNDNDYKGEAIVSCASCTTNCVAPIMNVLQGKIGVKQALLNTVHAYTSDQNLLDGSHKDWRRARAAAINIVPTSTGAAKATGEVISQLSGLFDGVAIRVPVATGSLADMVIVTAKPTTIDQINSWLMEAADGPLKGIVLASREPMVSSDVIGSSYSSIVDLELTNVVGGQLVRVVAWYDNEWGYTNRLVELADKISKN